jgi:pantetheine-phosphate adenylyltransferase
VRKAIYAGSFDPITNGHVDVINRALLLFDQIVIAIGVNVDKSGLFSVDERMNLIEKTFSKNKNVEVTYFTGLTADFAKKIKCNFLVRGLRDGNDFTFEMRSAFMNKHLRPSLETVFLPTADKFSNVSSSLLKEVASLGGDVSQFLPNHVASALKLKFAEKSGNLKKLIK